MVHIIQFHSGEPRLLIPEDIDEEELKGPATLDEIENLVELIGGFEGWGKLDIFCMRQVTKHLNAEALTNLRACSSLEQDIIDGMKVDVFSVELHDCHDELSEFPRYRFNENEVLVNIRFHTDTSKEHHVLFTQHGDDTLIKIAKRQHQQFRCIEPEEVRATLKSTYHVKEAVKFAEKWIRRGKFELERLVVNLKEYPFEESIIEYLPNCSELQLKTNDNEVFTYWLRRVPSRMQRLSVMRYYKDQRSYGQVGRDVVDFVACTMRYEAFDFQVEVFLGHWAAGFVPHNFDILKMITRGILQESMLNGPTVKNWLSDEFRNEEGVGVLLEMFQRKSFRHNRRFFQVYSQCNPYDSITVALSGYEVYIIRTGRMGHDNDGRPQREYYVPKDLEWSFPGE